MQQSRRHARCRQKATDAQAALQKGETFEAVAATLGATVAHQIGLQQASAPAAGADARPRVPRHARSTPSRARCSRPARTRCRASWSPGSTPSTPADPKQVAAVARSVRPAALDAGLPHRAGRAPIRAAGGEDDQAEHRPRPGPQGHGRRCRRWPPGPTRRRPRKRGAEAHAEVTCEPAFDAFDQGVRRRAGRRWSSQRLVDDLETPVSAYLKIAPRRALRLPVRIGRGRRLARALLDHGDAPGPGLALPGRPGRDRRGRRHRRRPLHARGGRRAGSPARPGGALAARPAAPACRRWPPACSASSATT